MSGNFLNPSPFPKMVYQALILDLLKCHLPMMVLGLRMTASLPHGARNCSPILRIRRGCIRNMSLNCSLKPRKFYLHTPTWLNGQFQSTQQYVIVSDQVFTVCGDTHGQYYDLLNIFKMNGSPSATRPYLFNGDFVDRGSFSVEVMLALLAWKVCNPNIMHLTRGNHESKNLNKLYGYSS
jgi:hypothetical protein